MARRKYTNRNLSELVGSYVNLQTRTTGSFLSEEFSFIRLLFAGSSVENLSVLIEGSPDNTTFYNLEPVLSALISGQETYTLSAPSKYIRVSFTASGSCSISSAWLEAFY